ncbi:hypothetical protein CMV_000542 [Castanea mollissima]|uniref:Gnk2-homologous domain-containing protein n=1 Tax=Castanea mollissima TaxID=60419 RepID=A0A8J4S3L4_9ROSI|nr:hypothetical protein CMV_000542 [Castanea mollissima]
MVNLVLFWLSFISLTGEALVPSYRYHFCSNETTFIPNSTYQSNLKDLLFSLSSNSTREIGFYNNTVGQNPETSVYGLFLCRGDLTPDDCQDCVSTAINEIVQQYCPVEKVALLWYDECMLRYSNRSIFSVVEEQPTKFLWNVLDITEPDRFLKLAQTTLSDLVPLAANASSGAKKCLQEAISNVSTCCSGKQGGRVMYPSCTIRYEVSPFYQIQAVAPPVPAPVPTLGQPPIPLLLPPPDCPQVFLLTHLSYNIFCSMVRLMMYLFLEIQIWNFLHFFRTDLLLRFTWMLVTRMNLTSRVKFGPPDLFVCCSIEGTSHNQSCLFTSTSISSELESDEIVWKIP